MVMTTQAYRVELDGDNIWAQRHEIVKHAQQLESFLHVGVRGNRQTISVLFTEERDAAWFRLKWTE